MKLEKDDYMSRILKDKTNQITQKYGNGHTGIDIVGKEGWPDIVAHSDGVVVAAVDGRDRDLNAKGADSYGNYVQIKHPNGMYTLYAHLKKGSVKVKKGDNVPKAELLGTEGNSGVTYGPHIHFEVRNKDNYVIDPTPYIDADLPNLPTNLPEPVEKNEEVRQVEILINDLRARNGYGLDKAILGFVKSGIYQIYDEQSKDGYNWLEIDKTRDIWIAYNKEWAIIYDIKDYKELYEKELLVNKDLQSQANNLNQNIANLNEKIKNAIDILNK